MTSSFNSLSDTTLEFQRSTSDTTRKNLTLFVQEFLQEFRIFVIDILDTVLFETAIFFFLTSTEGGVKYLISD